MNRTFLIILMIGTAMIIAVIGQHEPSAQLDTMPWEVDQLNNGSLRVFGITLEKTSIQDANQIFASFAKTQLQVSTDQNEYQTYQLVASYDDLLIGGVHVKINLTYQIKPEELQNIYDSLKQTELTEGTNSYPVSDAIKMQYLSAAVSSITYIPSIDYDLETIRQNFGLASDEKTIKPTGSIWLYPEMGLQIHINKDQPDLFIYAPLK